MKNVFLASAALLIFASIGCNSPIEWNDEMVAKFKTKCLNEFAEQFKAENPEDFCTCYVDKLKEKEMGMMDMLKETESIVKECGASM